MTSLSNGRIFGLAVAAGLALMLSNAAYERWQHRLPPGVSRLSERVAVSGQLKPDQVAQLKARGFATIIDLRPDGEAPGQPAAAAMQEAARRSGMRFAYVPVPHGAIPDAAVAALDQAIAANPAPVLLYCRSGRRAARTWALVEASRPGGANPGRIIAAVKAGGQSADDLRAELAGRAALRQQRAALQ